MRKYNAEAINNVNAKYKEELENLTEINVNN